MIIFFVVTVFVLQNEVCHESSQLFRCASSQMVCRFLCEEATEPLTEKQFIPAVRKFILRQLLAGCFNVCF